MHPLEQNYLIGYVMLCSYVDHVHKDIPLGTEKHDISFNYFTVFYHSAVLNAVRLQEHLNLKGKTVGEYIYLTKKEWETLSELRNISSHGYDEKSKSYNEIKTELPLNKILQKLYSEITSHYKITQEHEIKVMIDKHYGFLDDILKKF